MNAEVLSLEPDSDRSAEASIRLEQEILGGVLSYPQAMGYLRPSLAPEHFFEPLHVAIWEALRDLQDEHGTVAPTLLISRVGQMEGPGIPMNVYIARLVGDQCGTAKFNPDGLVAELLNHYARRQMQEIGGKLIEFAQGMADPGKSARAAIGDLDTILAARQRTNRTDSDLAGAIDDALASAAERYRNGGKPEITTGIPALDKKTGGLYRGRLSLIGGRPGMGKSTIIPAMMLKAARAGHGVVLFTLEMPRAEIGVRCVSALATEPYRAAPIPYYDIARGVFTEEQYRRMQSAKEQFAELPIVIDDQSGLSVSDISARLRRYREDLARKGAPLEIVLIDYLGLIRPDDRYKGRKVDEIGDISASLKRLSKDLNVPIVAAHQLSRQVETRENKRPQLADLRDSGSLEQDADTVMFLYRDAYYLSRSGDPDQIEHAKMVDKELDVIIAKNRGGPTGSVELYADMTTNIVEDRRFDGRQEGMPL